jgi:hypothetical protein
MGLSPPFSSAVMAAGGLLSVPLHSSQGWRKYLNLVPMRVPLPSVALDRGAERPFPGKRPRLMSLNLVGEYTDAELSVYSSSS